MSTDKDKTISVPMYGDDGVKIEGLNRDEVEILRGSMLGGHNWIRRSTEGRLEHAPSYEELPSPILDKEMHPFWQPAGEEVDVQLNMKTFDPERSTYDHSSPSIMIQYICAFRYSEENYKKTGEFLEECGFVCMRSRRNKLSGQFWEIWYLPDLIFSNGLLKDAIDKCDSKNTNEKVHVALEFLRINVGFGTLDIAVQRLGMPNPD